MPFKKAVTNTIEVGTDAGQKMYAQRDQLKQRGGKFVKRQRAKIHKVHYEDHVHSDDPEFNHIAARKVFDLVMKMDVDTAEMFTLIAIGEIYETTIEKNLGTLQRHLDEVIDKRLSDAKRAMMRTVAKGHTNGALSAARALDQISEIIKVGNQNPYQTGAYQFEESDFRRDPRSGQFQTKIKHNQKTPFSNRVATGLGLAPTNTVERRKYVKLSAAQRAQYQDEYRQLANFLNVAAQSTKAGDQNIFLRLEDKQGNEFLQPHQGGADAANPVLLNPNLKLLTVEAAPATLTAGGAAFGLAGALGGGGAAIGGTNRALGALKGFREDWTTPPTDLKSSNERLYNRVGAAGAYVGQIAPDNTKVGMAASVAEIVGSHGAEAEAVIGPAARKTAYRYRGTEKTPDEHIVTLYGRAISDAKNAGGAPLEQDAYEIAGNMARRAGGKPAAELARRQPTRVHAGGGVAGPAVGQMGATRAEGQDRPPNRAELAQGRRVIQDQLKLSPNFPKGSLYSLQASSGNLPPSEGILLNSKGQIVTQAVGYGDDHYLPFNLKNLKALKGGEYIRTRSAGGLTSEDIYTGLVSGARRVTVVSRSGTFSVEFKPDFRGGRRYNDKALRMTRRYEQLLDAVQSNKVSRGPVPPHVEQAIRQEVAEELRGESRAAIRAKVTERVREYQEDPDIGPEDEKIMSLVYEQGLKENPSRDASEWMKTARGLVMSGKKFNYQLDAAGYEAAQDALAEQFPYYITSHPVIEKEGQPPSAEKDKGYVEPGRNRPTAVQAGLYGTKANQAAGEQVGSKKFSASQADYQRGRLGIGQGDRYPRTQPKRGDTQEAAAAETAAGVLKPVAGAPAAKDQARLKMQTEDKAVDLYNEIKSMPMEPDFKELHNEVLKHDVPSFSTAVQDPEFRAQFDQMVDQIASELRKPTQPERLRKAWAAYQSARGDLGSIDFDPRMALRWTPEPMKFDGAGYGANDSDEDRDKAIRSIDKNTRSVTTGLTLSALAAKNDPDALRNELDALREVHQALRADPSLQGDDKGAERRALAIRIFGKDYDARAVQMIASQSADQLVERMTDVHRMRTLKAHYKGSWPGSRAVDEQTRPEPHDSVEQVMADVNKQAEVRLRAAALSRWRTGLPFDADSTPGDEAHAEAAEMVDRIDAGDMPSVVEVDQMLAGTQKAFDSLPDRHAKLDAGQRSLIVNHPEWFTRDPHGYLVYSPPPSR